MPPSRTRATPYNEPSLRLVIQGRGACDAKGIIAAMVKAAEQLIESGVSDFGLLFVVGEEAGSAGIGPKGRRM